MHKKIHSERDNNTRLGDISYQLSKIADELRIIREIATGSEITLTSDEFNSRMNQRYGK